MSSIFKSALLVSSFVLVLFQAVSAAPQPQSELGYGDIGRGSDISAFANQGEPAYGGFPTNIPVSPLSIVPETDFIPISNVQPIVNVLPVNVNDWSWPPIYNGGGFPYGNEGYAGGMGYGGYPGGLGYDGGLFGGY
ncbi:hypothetical protein FBU30_000818 [Linnemannia zychae]|nr:hypothetical protein FBU30_000818 [Linnemannia zychae]